MHISKIYFKNHRSFADETTLSLEPGMNLIIGENNSGKSTVLQALALDSIAYEPHLSLDSKPAQSFNIASEQSVGVEILIGKNELWKYLGVKAYIPLPSNNDSNAKYDFPSMLKTAASLTFVLEQKWLQAGVVQNNFSHLVFGGKHDGKFQNGSITTVYQCPEGANPEGGGISNLSGTVNFAPQLLMLWSQIYRFRAERLNISRCNFGHSRALRADAGNLAECLNWLQSNQPDLYAEYTAYVSRIFPSVYRVQATPAEANQLEVRAWLVPVEARRPDLTIPLSQLGTGVSQVLAILYAAMCAEHPMVIGIDEPNSFLHPKAVRALLQILNGLPTKHQYVVTTHSPEVIRAADPRTISVVTNISGRSSIQSLDPSNLEHIKQGLASIGARLSDVYGADQILWVEGETEELTFPKIASRIDNINTVGVTFLKVSATGDFESPKKIRPRLVFETYKRLANGGSLIPPAVAFIFDSDGRSQKDKDDLTAESDRKVRFLERLCYENYLIHPEAIAAVLANTSINSKVVEKWLAENGNSACYISPAANPLGDQLLWECDDWLTRVHAAKLLKAIFADLPEITEEYRKTTHSVALTEWLLEHVPSHLDSITALLNECLA